MWDRLDLGGGSSELSDDVMEVSVSVSVGLSVVRDPPNPPDPNEGRRFSNSFKLANVLLKLRNVLHVLDDEEEKGKLKLRNSKVMSSLWQQVT